MYYWVSTLSISPSPNHSPSKPGLPWLFHVSQDYRLHIFLTFLSVLAWHCRQGSWGVFLLQIVYSKPQAPALGHLYCCTRVPETLFIENSYLFLTEAEALKIRHWKACSVIRAHSPYSNQHLVAVPTGAGTLPTCGSDGRMGALPQPWVPLGGCWAFITYRPSLCCTGD